MLARKAGVVRDSCLHCPKQKNGSGLHLLQFDGHCTKDIIEEKRVQSRIHERICTFAGRRQEAWSRSGKRGRDEEESAVQAERNSGYAW